MLASVTRLVPFLLALALLTGCGYRFSPHGDGGGGGPTRSVVLETVENLIRPPRPGLEFEFTRKLKDEMALDRRFELSSSGTTRVRVQLTEFREPALARDFNNQQTEIALVVVAEVQVVDGNDSWGGVVSGRASYAPGHGEGRDAGLARLWRNLARNVIDVIGDRDWMAN